MDLSMVKQKAWIYPCGLSYWSFPAKLRQTIQEVGMRNVVGLAAVALGLAGCASTQTILEGSADDVVTSTKTAEAVAFCIGEKNMAAPFKREDGSYIISIKSAVGTTGIVYTVAPDCEGSRVEVRRANSPVSVTKFRNCL